jgi:hypothetical protein
MVQFSPSGRLLNMHAQMAHSPAVLEAYVSIRRATGQHGTLDQQVRTALMLTAAGVQCSPARAHGLRVFRRTSASPGSTTCQ